MVEGLVEHREGEGSKIEAKIRKVTILVGH